MKNVRPSFEIFENDIEAIPIGFTPVRWYIIWHVKLGEHFRCKARFVVGGHTRDFLSSLTYYSVVFRESVRIALRIVALNNVNILVCYIQNKYLTATYRKKIYTIACPEFGSKQGSIMVIKITLYGFKSSGSAYRSKVAAIIWDLEYRLTPADPDTWFRPNTNKQGMNYYEMIFCYVGDILVISHDSMDTISGIQKISKLKGNKAIVLKLY